MDSFPFFAKAIKQFTTDQADDLALYPDDIIQVTRLVNENWYHGKLREERGIFPVKFVIPLAIPPCSKPHGIALYDHNACIFDELTFKAGDLIVLTEKVNDEWYIGTVGLIGGMFPINYLKIVKDIPPPPNPKTPPNPSSPSFNAPTSPSDKISLALSTIETTHKHSTSSLSTIETTQKHSTSSTKMSKETVSSDENDIFCTPCSSPINSTIAPQAVVINKFTAQLDEEIDMMVGDRVYLLEHVDECFTKVRNGDEVGLVPISFLDVVEPLPATTKKNVKTDNQGNILSPTYTDIVNALADDFNVFRYPSESDVDDKVMELMPKVPPPEPPEDKILISKPSRPPPIIDSSSDSEPRHKPDRPKSFIDSDSSSPVQVSLHYSLAVPSSPEHSDQPKRPPALDVNTIETLRRSQIENHQEIPAEKRDRSPSRPRDRSPSRPRDRSPSRPRQSYNNRDVSDLSIESDEVLSAVVGNKPPPVDLATLPREDDPPCALDQLSNVDHSDSKEHLTPIHDPNFHTYNERVEYYNDADIANMRAEIEHSKCYTEVSVSNESSPVPPRDDSPVSSREGTPDNMHPNVDALTLSEYNRLQKKITATEKLLQIEVTSKNETESKLAMQFSGKKVDQESVKLLQMLIGAHKNKISDLSTSLDNMRATIRTMGVPDTSTKLSNAQKRDRVAEELLHTERDHCRQLELCISGFVYNLKQWKDHTMDTDILFMNMEDILNVSRQLLMMLEGQFTLMPHEQMLGRCFTHLTKDIHDTYTPYLQNHTYAASLLTEYIENKKNVILLNKCLQHIREETTCWDLQSFLIKPVQRIMRYPMLLKELLTLSPTHWPDRPHLSDAISLIDSIVRDANEEKRKTEILKRYSMEASDTSIIPKLSMHGFKKKSRRFTTALTQSLKITNSVVEDDEFATIAEQFLTLTQVVKNLLRETNNFTDLLNKVQNEMESLCTSIHNFYNDLETQKDVFMYHAAAMTIANTYTPRFITDLNEGPLTMLQDLQSLFAGPQFYIDKRAAKLLDYDNLANNLANNKSELLDKHSFVHEHVKIAKGTFEALNKQLLEDLPEFNREGAAIVRKCSYSVLALLSHYSQSCYNELKTTLVKMSSALNDVPTSLAEYHKSRMKVCCAQLLTISSFHPDVTSAIVLGGALPKPAPRPTSQFFDDTSSQSKDKTKKKRKRRSSLGKIKNNSKKEVEEKKDEEEQAVDSKVGSWLQAQNDCQYSSSSDMSDGGIVEEMSEIVMGTVCTVLYTFTSAGDFMLTVNEGDVVEVLVSCSVEQAWCYVERGDARGYVPRSYLASCRKRRAPIAPTGNTDCLTGGDSLENSPQNSGHQGRKSKSPDTSSKDKKIVPLRSSLSMKRQAPAPPNVRRQTSAATLTNTRNEPPLVRRQTSDVTFTNTYKEPLKEETYVQEESDTSSLTHTWSSSPVPSPVIPNLVYSDVHSSVEIVEQAPSPTPARTPSPKPVAATQPSIIPKRSAPPPPYRTDAPPISTSPKNPVTLAPYKKAPAPRPSIAEAPKTKEASMAKPAPLIKKESIPYFDACPQEFSAYANIKPNHPSSCPTSGDKRATRCDSLIKVEVLFDYTKKSEEELSVSRGLVINLLEKDDVDWWYVRDGTREGYVPANYLKLL